VDQTFHLPFVLTILAVYFELGSCVAYGVACFMQACRVAVLACRIQEKARGQVLREAKQLLVNAPE
jgi:hypothetical protein